MSEEGAIPKVQQDVDMSEEGAILEDQQGANWWSKTFGKVCFDFNCGSMSFFCINSNLHTHNQEYKWSSIC